MVTSCCFAAQPVANQSPASRDKPSTSARPEDILWSSAQECLQKAQYQETRRKFEQFSRKYRTDSRFKEAIFYQGLCELKLGQEIRALSRWDQMLKREMLEQTRSRALLLTLEQLAGYYTRKGQAAKLEKTLIRLRTDFPDAEATVTMHAQAAEARMKISDYAGALELYRAVEKKLAANDLKNMDLAVTMTTKGAGNPRKLLTSANESFENNNVDQAITLYQIVLKQNPDAPVAAEAMTRLGWCYYVQGKWQEAVPLWKEVIRKSPARNEWVGKSRWHLIQVWAGPAGKVEKAIKLCEIQAEEFAGDMYGERGLFSKAWLYWTRQDWVKAKSAFDELLAAYPANANDPPVQEYIRDCEEGIQKRGGRK